MNIFTYILDWVPLAIFISVILILLILIADKIIAVAKERKDGFLSLNWKSILILYTLTATAIFILFYIVIIIFA
jgi:hypothetical protein